MAYEQERQQLIDALNSQSDFLDAFNAGYYGYSVGTACAVVLQENVVHSGRKTVTFECLIDGAPLYNSDVVIILDLLTDHWVIGEGIDVYDAVQEYGIYFAWSDSHNRSLGSDIEFVSFNVRDASGNDITSDYSIAGLYYCSQHVAPALQTPTGLYADNITSDSARVSWNAVENATSYKVEYRRQGDTTWNE